jgi:transposase-like protein
MSPTLPSSRPLLKSLMNRDPDPRVRRRAHALLLAAEGRPLSRIAQLFQTAPHRLRAWRTRLRTRGRACSMRPAQDGPPSSVRPL